MTQLARGGGEQRTAHAAVQRTLPFRLSFTALLAVTVGVGTLAAHRHSAACRAGHEPLEWAAGLSLDSAILRPSNAATGPGGGGGGGGGGRHLSQPRLTAKERL
eukprot:COSAG02_NODE_879_length_16244_cov_15.397956_9_plen_104_part_00